MLATPRGVPPVIQLSHLESSESSGVVSWSWSTSCTYCAMLCRRSDFNLGISFDGDEDGEAGVSFEVLNSGEAPAAIGDTRHEEDGTLDRQSKTTQALVRFIVGCFSMCGILIC